MLDLDLSNPVNQVRAIIGDWESEWISDDNIQYFLDAENGDTLLASAEIMSAILNRVAYYIRHEVGDAEIYYQDLYNQIADRKDSLEKDVLYKKMSNLFTFGGTTKSEMSRVRNNNETPVRSNSITNKEFTALLERIRCFPPEDRFNLCWTGNGY